MRALKAMENLLLYFVGSYLETLIVSSIIDNKTRGLKQPSEKIIQIILLRYFNT